MILPIVNNSESDPVNEPGVCWRKEWIRDLESFGSMICKFAFLNAAEPKDIIWLLGNDQEREFPHLWRARSRDDLRGFGSFNVKSLIRTFQTNPRQLHKAIVAQYLRKREGWALTSSDFRFCPKCIRVGFHSGIYQVLLITKCPVHGSPLTVSCSHCKMRKVPYTLHALLAEIEKDCERCLGALQRAPNGFGRGAQVQFKVEGLAATANWLIRRGRSDLIAPPIWEWIDGEATAGWKARHVTRLRRYWVDLMDEAPPSDSPRRLPREIHVVVQKQQHASPTQSSVSEENSTSIESELLSDAFDLSLFRIFKSIRRHLKKRELARHRKCLKSVQRGVQWRHSLWTHSGRLCPHANAFLWWLMFWLEVRDPFDLDNTFRRRWKKNRTPPRLRWQPSTTSVSPPILQHLFALECLARYRECWLRSCALSRKGRYSFSDGHLNNRRMPYWVVDGRNGLCVLHLWPRVAIDGSGSSLVKHGKGNGKAKCDNSGLAFLWPQNDLGLQLTNP